MESVNVASVRPQVDNESLRSTLRYLQTYSPVVIVVVFVIAFIANSVISAKKVESHVAITTGPGGRPLPKRMRSAAVISRQLAPDFSQNTKLAFKWLSVAVLLTFVADAALTMTHVILHRQQHWWPGQSVVVCCASSHFPGVDS